MKIKFLTESLSVEDIFTDEELSKFDNWQMTEIRTGLKNGLTEEQVKLYANPEFDWDQMQEIRKGLENGLTKEEVELYANPEFNSGQMFIIKFMLQDYKYHRSSITMEDIEDILDADIPYQKMVKYRMSFE